MSPGPAGRVAISQRAWPALCFFARFFLKEVRMKKFLILAVFALLASATVAEIAEAGLFRRGCGNRSGLFQRLRGGGGCHR